MISEAKDHKTIFESKKNTMKNIKYYNIDNNLSEIIKFDDYNRILGMTCKDILNIKSNSFKKNDYKNKTIYSDTLLIIELFTSLISNSNLIIEIGKNIKIKPLNNKYDVIVTYQDHEVMKIKTHIIYNRSLYHTNTVKEIPQNQHVSLVESINPINNTYDSNEIITIVDGDFYFEILFFDHINIITHKQITLYDNTSLFLMDYLPSHLKVLKICLHEIVHTYQHIFGFTQLNNKNICNIFSEHAIYLFNKQNERKINQNEIVYVPLLENMYNDYLSTINTIDEFNAK